MNIPAVVLVFIFSLVLVETFPQPRQDLEEVKLLLQQLMEHSDPASSQEPARDLLTARDLRTVRLDPKRFSGCFGRKLDRIGAMSTLGCNTVSRSGPRRK